MNKKKLDNYFKKIPFPIQKKDFDEETGFYDVTFKVPGGPREVTKTLHDNLKKVMKSDYMKAYPSVDGYGTVSIKTAANIIDTEKIVKKAMLKQSMLDLHMMIRQKLKLKPEGGVTRTSLENLKKIKKEFDLEKASFHFKASNNTRLHTEWTTETFDGQDIIFVWEFTGFSAGYVGEGSRGLVEALKILGIKTLKEDQIFSPNFKPAKYSLFFQ